MFKYWKHILNTLKSVSKYIWFGKGTDYETSWYIEYTLCFPFSPNKVLTRGKRLLFISRLKTNACSSEYQQCFFFFFFYIGAIFIYLPLSVLTFYFVLLKKFAKYILFQILRKMVNTSPLKRSQAALHPVPSSRRYRAGKTDFLLRNHRTWEASKIDENWDIYSILSLLAAFRFRLIKSLVSKLRLLINLSHNIQIKRCYCTGVLK